MSSLFLTAFLVAALGLSLPAQAGAQHGPDQKKPDTPQQQTHHTQPNTGLHHTSDGHSDPTSSGHHMPHGPHHISLFQGGTSIDGDGLAYTIGIDYEYRVSELLGLGVVAEYAFGDIDATTLLAVADIHIYRGLIMQIGPGVELGSSDHFVTRVGALYELEWGPFTLSPQFHVDFTEGAEDALVFGIAVGRAF